MAPLVRHTNITYARIGTDMNDLTGTPTFACICGCAMFKVRVIWDESDRTIGWYEDKQECVECGSILSTPTPIDEEA